MPVDNSEWDGPAAMARCDTAACFRAICAGERSEGEPDERQHWALPHHKTSDSGPNANGVRNALARLPQTQGLKDAGAARAHLERHMSEVGGGAENRTEPERRAPIETRAATVGEVDYPKRLIEVLAVPYGQEAVVEYRGELWNESFEKGSFDGVERRPNRIKAYRDHDPDPSKGSTTRGLIGRVISLSPDRTEGLMGEVRIAKTPLGDETLTLADEGILGVSVGFAVRGSDQVLNRMTRQRKIRRAFLDHLAFPDNGAYTGAGVVGVRTGERTETVELPRLDTPRLDEVVAWMESRRK